MENLRLDRKNVPSQAQIDRIASFVEAARELKKEPFLHSDEERSLSFRGNNYTFNVGDRFHFRSALVTFRRIWMEGEASHFFDCHNILWQYQPFYENGLVRSWRDDASKILNGRAFNGLPIGLDEVLKGQDLIDLWINGVFAHVSLKRGTDKRHKFERYMAKYGSGVMEFAFRSLVWRLSIAYENTRKIGAEQFLEHWKESAGLEPSFRIGVPFGEKMREVTPEGHVILRKSSSKFYNEESIESFFDRVLSRGAYRQLKSLSDQLEGTASQKAKLLMFCPSIDEILKKGGLSLKLNQE